MRGVGSGVWAGGDVVLIRLGDRAKYEKPMLSTSEWTRQNSQIGPRLRGMGFKGIDDGPKRTSSSKLTLLKDCGLGQTLSSRYVCGHFIE